MMTLRDKFTCTMVTIVCLVFHLRLGPDMASTLLATAEQLLLTAPYAIGFTYITATIVRRMMKTGWPSWDKLLRIYCTFAIIFAFFFALYEYAQQGQPGEELEKVKAKEVTLSSPLSSAISWHIHV